MINIDNKKISDKSPVFIIAEAGVNHNGSFEMAKRLIDVAKRAGADAVKFQTFKAKDLAVKHAKKESYMKTKDKNQYDMLSRLELSNEDYKNLALYCKKKNIIFLSTPYDEPSADFLEKLNVSAFKIGSGEITHIPLIEHVAKKGLPVIISTGASNISEVSEAVRAIKRQGNNKIILLHCTSYYPAPFDQINLRVIQTLQKLFGVIVGYSDHTQGIAASIGAVALGARVIEKHFTSDKNLEGPDHKASIEPKELKELILNIRNIEKALGTPEKRPTKVEHEEITLGRRSIVASRNIIKGEIITSDMLAVKRPGTGLAPKYITKLIGKTAKNNIPKDTLLSLKQAL